MRDAARLKRAMEGIDIVVHAAALAFVKRYFEQPALLAADAARQSAAFDARAAGAHEHLFDHAALPLQRAAA